jgi:hypothetical protein
LLSTKAISRIIKLADLQKLSLIAIVNGFSVQLQPIGAVKALLKLTSLFNLEIENSDLNGKAIAEINPI